MAIDIGFGVFGPPWMKSGITSAAAPRTCQSFSRPWLGETDVHHVGLGQSPQNLAVERGMRFE